MFTPGFASLRKAGNDYKIPGTKHVIPRDTPVWIPSVAFHYDEKFFKNPQKFDPEHFSVEENAKRPTCVYMPFGKQALKFFNDFLCFKKIFVALQCSIRIIDFLHFC